MKNLFITFEGVDGAGKTTLAELVTRELKYKYLSAIPDLLSPLLPEISKTKSPLVTFNFFSLCNSIRSIEIKELLLKNGVIIDRYFFSTFSYHRLMLGDTVDDVLKLYRNEKSNFLLPDIIIFVTASKEVIHQRISKRENGENKKQWYGDKISLSLDLISSYKITLDKMQIPYFHIDTSDKTPEEGCALILDYIQNREE
ncbi:MAG: deoxynucleoside kinase [Leptospiraceae bacterium]|nr:deoxynucleoside kinase [Leptospiraceae bacterium]